MRIFVSYARRDREAVDALLQDVRRARHDVWADEELTGGQSWWDTILGTNRGADLFVVTDAQIVDYLERTPATTTRSTGTGPAVSTTPSGWYPDPYRTDDDAVNLKRPGRHSQAMALLVIGIVSTVAIFAINAQLNTGSDSGFSR